MLFADNLAAGPRLSIGHGFGLYSAQKRYHRAAEQVNMTGSQAGLRFPFPRNSRFGCFFTAAIEIYYVISFRFLLMRRNRRNFVCQNPPNAKGSHIQYIAEMGGGWGRGVVGIEVEGTERRR